MDWNLKYTLFTYWGVPLPRWAKKPPKIIWGNGVTPAFNSCCQTHELLGSSTPCGWDSNDPGDLLVIDSLERGLLNGVQSMFLQIEKAFRKDCQGRKQLSIGGFQLHVSCDILPNKRPRVISCSVCLRPVPFTSSTAQHKGPRHPCLQTWVNSQHWLHYCGWV